MLVENEQVLEIQLTQHGKRLLAEGKLNPSYYSFSDDDILYDGAYANLSESQNSIETRIFETPRHKALYNFHGVESEFQRLKKVYTIDRESQQNVFLEFAQSEPSRVYETYKSLGTSDYSSNALPAWDISLYSGEISSSAEVISGSDAVNVLIPQINLKNVEYDISVLDNTIPQNLIDNIRTFNIPDAGIPNYQFDDGTVLEIVPEDIFIEVNELNALFNNENFEMEIYLVEEVSDTQGIREELKPLYFGDKPFESKDIWVEPEINQTEIIDDESMVSYYLEVLVDGEIPNEDICKYVPREKRRGVYDRLYDCEPKQPDEVFDIYDTDADGIGEDCD